MGETGDSKAEKADITTTPKTIVRGKSKTPKSSSTTKKKKRASPKSENSKKITSFFSPDSKSKNSKKVKKSKSDSSSNSKIAKKAATSVLESATIDANTKTDAEKEKEIEKEKEKGKEKNNGSSDATKLPKTPKAKPKKATTTPSKPKKATMLDMILESIRALKSRNGSSTVAIQKYILATFPEQKDSNAFRSRLSQTIKKGVKSGQFIRIKASYKISAEFTRKEKARKSREAAKKVAERKKAAAAKKKEDLKKKKEEEKKTPKTPKTPKKKLSKEELARLKAEEEDRIVTEKLRQEAERRAKERAERLRKRKFPMEDTKLHTEDKELGVVPSGVKKRPKLPFLLQAVVRPDAPKVQCDTIDYDNRGLVSDLLQIYHFFRGDVGFGDMCPNMVAEFSLRHLWFAVDEVSNGNTKKSKMIPPLLSHLFLVSLQLVLSSSVEEDPRLAQDLSSLKEALTPASWAEICVMYMECMERYYSISKGVLTPGYIDAEFLFGRTDTFQEKAMLEETKGGYFGGKNAILGKAYDKLNRQDPWCLSAEELLSLLRALTDDIIATRPDINIHISEREEELAGLLKEKRSADSNYRKIRLAVEGPMRKPKAEDNKQTDESKQDSSSSEKKEEDKEEGNEEGKNENETKKKLAKKPKYSKRQFEQAGKDQQRAQNAYEKAVLTHVARTKATGQDRHFNQYFSFHKDPEVLYIEVMRSGTGLAPENLPPNLQLNRTTWHAVDKVSLLSSLVESLDKRGTRERHLKEQLTENKKIKIHDDVKEEEAKERRKKKMKEFLKLREDCKMRVMREAEGSVRRSGRFDSDAQAQLNSVEMEIKELEIQIEEDNHVESPNYLELTGIEALQAFDMKVKRARTLRKKLGAEDDDNDENPLRCATSMIPSGNADDGTGLVGLIVNDMMEVEKLCENLVPSGEESNLRISQLKDLVTRWNDACPTYIGPDIKNENNKSKGISVRYHVESIWEERSRVRKLGLGCPIPASSASNQATLNQLLDKIKKPLLDLEERIYEVSGLSMAHQDQNTADDNMSAADETEEQERKKQLMAWKRKIHIISKMASKRGSDIRETLVQAIDAARKANLGNIVPKLRSALLLYHPTAPGECKQAAIAVLKENGGYDTDDDDEEESDDESKENEEDDKEKDEELSTPSNLCFEAMSLHGSLGNSTSATRKDWIDAVKKCKTISRLAALSAAFLRKATLTLEKLSSERDALEKALEKWKREEERNKRRGGGGKQNNKKVEHKTEMWADVEYTDDFCMVNLQNHPWWPAKKCIAKDRELRESLRNFDRVLVAMVGEHGELRCVKSKDIRKFTGKAVVDKEGSFSKLDLSQLEESLAIARRILRGRKKLFLEKDHDDDGFQEEKKSAT